MTWTDLFVHCCWWFMLLLFVAWLADMPARKVDERRTAILRNYVRRVK